MGNINVATILDRSAYYRMRAAEVRAIARTLPDEHARTTLTAIGDDYERLAEAQDEIILTKARIEAPASE